MPASDTPLPPLRHVARGTAVIGLQWGDEGKGKIVDCLAARHHAVVRYNGGANAGHSVVHAGQRFALHLVPAGVLHRNVLAVVANGVVLDPAALLAELDALEARGIDTSGVVISNQAHVVAPWHHLEDDLREELLRSGETGNASDEHTHDPNGRAALLRDSEPTPIGTTRRGIGPCYADKVQRANAIRIGDLLRPGPLRHRVALACCVKNATLEALARLSRRPFTPFDPDLVAAELLRCGERLRPRIRNTTALLHDLLRQGRALLFEGANGTLLDVDHGTYPYVTASACAAGGIAPGTGLPPACVDCVLGVLKAYTTRVGHGPFPTELHDALGEHIRQRGREFGTTTGRPRRVGWLDLVAVRYAARLNGANALALTMLDVLDDIPTLRVCTAYRLGRRTLDDFPPDAAELAGVEPIYTELEGFRREVRGVRRRDDLPPAAIRYVEFIERFVGVPVAMVSVGPERDETVEPWCEPGPYWSVSQQRVRDVP